MKFKIHTFLFFLFLIVRVCVLGQALPKFKLYQPDGNIVTNTNLDHYSPKAVIYFSPDCNSCQDFIQHLMSKRYRLKKIQLVLICASDLKTVKAFNKKFGTDKVRNFFIGTEGILAPMGKKLGVTNIPFMALYNSRQKLIGKYAYNGNIESMLNKIYYLK